MRWADVLRELPCQSFSSLSRVTSGTRRFLWATATRLSRCDANILGDPVRWFGCGTGTGSPRHHHQGKIVCLGMLALMDRVSLVNRLEPVGDMPMSLLAFKAWISPNVWTRAAHCSATLSGDAVQSGFKCSHTNSRLNRCRRAVQYGAPQRRNHVLDSGAVSVPRVSLSSSPTAPSIQTVLGYSWDHCGKSFELNTGKHMASTISLSSQTCSGSLWQM